MTEQTTPPCPACPGCGRETDTRSAQTGDWIWCWRCGSVLQVQHQTDGTTTLRPIATEDLR